MAEAKTNSGLLGGGDSPTGSGTTEGNLIDFDRILRVMRERWLGALLLSALACSAVGWMLLRETPVYAATATLLVERSTDRVVDIKQVVDNTVDSSLTDALLLTHIQQIHSHTFFVRVINSLTPAERHAVLAPYPRVNALPPPSSENAKIDEDERMEAIIDQGLKVERSGRTLLITLTVRHRDPAVAQMLANRLGDEYIAHLIDRSTASNDSALVFLQSQAEDLRKKLETAEQKLQAYREKYNLFFMEQNQNMVIERLRTLSASVTQARVARLALEGRLTQAQSILRDGNADQARSLSSLPEFSGYANVQKQMDELRAKRDVLAERYGRRHPLMQENASSLETLDRLRKQEINAAVTDLSNQRDKALMDEKQLAGELAATEKESLRVDQLSVNFNFLRREVESTRDTYSQILNRLNDTTISSRLQNTNIKFVDRAGLPDRPVSPNRLKILAIVVALGGVVMVGYPLAADMRDTRIKTWWDIENYLGVSLIGEISSARNIAKKDRGWIVARTLDEDIVEAFRGLHNQIQLTASATAKTLLVSSTIPAEGKSFVVENLGATFAAHGRRTLLIDADFRRPSLHGAFQVDNTRGIIRYLEEGGTGTDDVLGDPNLGIIAVSPGLYLLRSGGVSRKLTEMLQSSALVPLIQTLQHHFDVILIDTSPAGVFPDAEAFCRLADGLIYICGFNGPTRLHVRQTLNRLGQRGVPFLGAVLNSVPPGRVGGNYLSAWSHGRRHYRGYYERRA